MKTLRAHAHGLANLNADFDGAALPDGLIALVGEIGSGKTSFLDVLGGPAVIFRELSSKPGSLRDSCSVPAVIDVTIEYNGSEYRHLLQIDPDKGGGRGETKAYLWKNGVPQGEGGSDGSTKAYDAAVLAVYPSKEVFYASAFASQDKAGSFFAMLTPAGQPDVPRRKELFAQLLGLGDLQRIADRAAEQRKLADAKLGELDAKNAALLEASAKAAGTRAALDVAEAAVPDLERAAVAAQADLTAAVKAAADATAQLDGLTATRNAALGRLAEVDRDIAAAERDETAAANSLHHIDFEILSGPEVRTRAARLAVVTTALATATADARAAGLAVEQTRATHQQALRAHREALAAKESAVRGKEECSTATWALAAVEARLVGHAALRLQLTATQRDLATRSQAVAQQKDAAALTQRQAETHERDLRAQLDGAKQKAGLLVGVPCKGETVRVHCDDDGDSDSGWRDCSACRFLGDARQAKDAIPALTESLADQATVLAVATSGLAVAREAEQALAAEITAYNARAATLAALDLDVAKLDGLRMRVDQHDQCAAVIADADARLPALGIAARLAEEDALVAERNHDIAAGLREQQQVESRALTGADQDLKQVESAEARRPGIEAARSAAALRLQQAQTTRAGVMVPPSPEAAAQAQREARQREGDAEYARDQAAGALNHQRGQVARLRGALDILGDTAAQQATVAREREALALRRSGFVLLEQAFGLNGIQALESDAAAPEVSTLTNDLLSQIFGPRFTLSLRTIREAGAGKQQREIFDCLIADGQQGSGAPRPFASFSGGEKACIDLCFRVALCVFNARRHSSIFSCLCLDEVDGALSADLSARYPSMLRKAQELGGFTRIYFISHRSTVWTQADAVIQMVNGVATVDVL